jgi:hypothetical protein
MIFAGRAVVERILRERWIESVNLYPTVRLSVRQILRQISQFAGSMLIPFDQLSSPRWLRSADGRNSIGSAAHLGDDQSATTSWRPGYPPLARIFVRLNDADGLSRSRSRTTLLQDELSETTRRIIENTQRIEERNARLLARSSSLVFRQPQPSVISVNETQRSDDLKSARERERGLPSFDVDELTNHVIRQIDQRATAWRERMGKI